MNLYEDLQRNRAVFEAAVGAVEGKNTTGWEAADLGPVRPPPMGGGAAAQPTASPAPQARGGRAGGGAG